MFGLNKNKLVPVLYFILTLCVRQETCGSGWLGMPATSHSANRLAHDVEFPRLAPRQVRGEEKCKAKRTQTGSAEPRDSSHAEAGSAKQH